MAAKGYTGISFPYRINGKGSTETSTTSPSRVDHIAESVQQILGTSPQERIHEPQIGAGTNAVIFGNMDAVRQAQFKSQTVAGMAQDRRVQLRALEVTEIPERGILAMTVDFGVPQTLASGRVNIERRVI